MPRFSKIFVALSLMLCIQLSTQSLAWGFYHNPAYPGKCFINADLILSPGESANYPEGCAEILCRRGNTGEASIIGCSLCFNCEYDNTADSSSKYPLCCKPN